MSERKLKIWNGNAQTFVPCDEARRRGLRHNIYVHAFGCAPSRAELCRMLTAWSGGGRALDAYIRDYWSEGAWGNSMTGVVPEYGLWVQYDRHDKPEKVWPPAPSSTQQGEGK
jgi:hypothetical protein